MGAHRKYTRDALAAAAAESSSVAGVLRHLGIPMSGGMHTHISRRLKHFGIDTSHFSGSGHQRGKRSLNRLAADQILVLRAQGSNRVKPHVLRRALLEIGVPYCCAHCGLAGEWQGKPLVLHIDHIDGNYEDCRRENLRFLCPNGHTQTPSWAGRNKVLRSYRRPPPSTTALGGFVTLRLFEADRDRTDQAS